MAGYCSQTFGPVGVGRLGGRAAVERGGAGVQRGALGDQRHRIEALGERRRRAGRDALAHQRHHRRSADQHDAFEPRRCRGRAPRAGAGRRRASDRPAGRSQASYSDRVTIESTSTLCPSTSSAGDEDRRLGGARQLDLGVLGGEPERAQRWGVPRVRAIDDEPSADSRASARSTRARSKSRPPRKLSPSWPTTRRRPSRVSSSETSKVPPPRS